MPVQLRIPFSSVLVREEQRGDLKDTSRLPARIFSSKFFGRIIFTARARQEEFRVRETITVAKSRRENSVYVSSGRISWTMIRMLVELADDEDCSRLENREIGTLKWPGDSDLKSRIRRFSKYRA